MQCILFLLTSPAPYGAEHSILSNINYLVKKKKIKPIFIIRNNGVLEKYLIKKKYQYFIIPFFLYILTIVIGSDFWLYKYKVKDSK